MQTLDRGWPSRTSHARVLGGLLMLLAVLALVACNGGGDNTATDTPGPTVVASGTLAPTAAPGAGDFEKLAASYAAGVDGRVKYSIDSKNFGVHPQGTWVTYRREGEIREDWEQDANGYLEKSVAIIANDGFFFCSETPSLVTCDEQPSAKELEVILLLFTTVKDYPGALLNGVAPYTVADLPGETIAGEETACFDVTVDGRIGGGPEGAEKVKFCFREDGTLLKYERIVTFTDPSQPEAWLNAIAQEVGDASPGDFVVPGSPTQPAG